MADPKTKKAPAAKGAAKGAVTKRNGLNANLSNGVYRFSRSRQYHKKALWKFMGKKTAKTVKPQKPRTVEKPIGGDKNGGKRVVLIKKRTSAYPTANRIRKHPTKKLFSEHRRYTRPTLTPGTVCILLAGVHKGKRVVLMKVLKSGLLLVNGPFKVNACPLRRVHQNFVIATSTTIDISGVKLPEKINDDYFRRQRVKRAKKEEGEIFAKKEEKYAPSEERKKDQAEVDKQLIEAIRKNPEKKTMFAYLKSMFGLRSSQYPHRIKF
ncbi:60S ribosomal protein L6 [Frankliniella occidentalis]|uniref:Large ribosomal subunit protein eL6 n=1 Tax=Frankliniella occidentalis TaxID=133901 RepID=A0A6J1S7R7_FRAOC|nr:60S ribosomal protein L6 [Frankliniella occidentalis]XP_026277235.1 60S ribosomal protein L6 [Frankliniella occidentalis]